MHKRDKSETGQGLGLSKVQKNGPFKTGALRQPTWKKGGGKAAPSETYHKAVVVHVENKVLAHDGKANQGNVSSAKNGQGVTKQGHARATASMSEETAVTTKKKRRKKASQNACGSLEPHAFFSFCFLTRCCLLLCPDLLAAVDKLTFPQTWQSLVFFLLLLLLLLLLLFGFC